MGAELDTELDTELDNELDTELDTDFTLVSPLIRRWPVIPWWNNSLSHSHSTVTAQSQHSHSTVAAHVSGHPVVEQQPAKTGAARTLHANAIMVET